MEKKKLLLTITLLGVLAGSVFCEFKCKKLQEKNKVYNLPVVITGQYLVRQLYMQQVCLLVH